METEYLDELKPRHSPSTAVIPYTPAGLPSTRRFVEVLDVEEEQRKKTYTLAMEARKAWEAAYMDYIFPTLYYEVPSDDALAQLTELERLLDSSMISLAGTGDDRVMKQVSELKVALRKKLKPEERRAHLRSAARKVNKAFLRMAYRAAYPERLQRMKRALGFTSVRLKIPTEERETLRLYANETLAGVGRKLAEVLHVRSDIVAAFDTLVLPYWASLDDVVNRRNYLAKQYHPDVNPSGLNRMQAINAAVDLLVAEHFTKPKGNRQAQSP